MRGFHYQRDIDVYVAHVLLLEINDGVVLLHKGNVVNSLLQFDVVRNEELLLHKRLLLYGKVVVQ